MNENSPGAGSGNGLTCARKDSLVGWQKRVRTSDHSSSLYPRPSGDRLLSLRVLWACVRLPLLAVLVVLEPLVCFGLGALGLLLVLTALFLEIVSTQTIPFAGMLVAGMSCVALIALYQALLRVLS